MLIYRKKLGRFHLIGPVTPHEYTSQLLSQTVSPSNGNETLDINQGDDGEIIPICTWWVGEVKLN